LSNVGLTRVAPMRHDSSAVTSGARRCARRSQGGGGGGMTVPRRPTALLLVAAATILLAGCQGGFHADPQGTLDRAREGVLRVGVSENPPLTDVAPDGTVGGSEVELLTDYAETIDAGVEWVPAGENTLAAM